MKLLPAITTAMMNVSSAVYLGSTKGLLRVYLGSTWNNSAIDPSNWIQNHPMIHFKSTKGLLKVY